MLPFMPPSRALPALLLGALALASCAPASAGKPVAGAPAAKEDPGEACLRIAGARRERRPNEPSRVAVKHVLVKHAFSKKADGAVRRTREEACLRALEARDKIRAGAEFGAVVREYSDEAGAASREGSIGAVERSDLVPPFADAAFELDLNQLSDVVESEFGFHVILRTE
jgi:NIMA-interacting peptidyl-prolyl cis-trans isomerase 1